MFSCSKPWDNQSQPLSLLSSSLSFRDNRSESRGDFGHWKGEREKEGEKAIVLCTIMPSDHYHQRRRNRFFLWRSYSYFFCFTLEPSITVPSFCDSASASSVYLLKQSCSVLVAVEDTNLFSSFFLHSLRRHCVSLCTSRVYLPLCLLYLDNAANCAMAPHGQRQPPLVLFP